MKLSQLICEGISPKVKKVADDIINQFADENYHNHDAIVKKAREVLEKDPEFKDDQGKLLDALKAISDYVK